MEILELVKDWGPSGAAACVAITMAVIFIRDGRDQRKEHREQVNALISNHFIHCNTTLDGLKEEFGRVRDVLERLADKL